MAKKSGCVKSKGNAGKRVSGNKPRKAGMFKALKKQEKRAGVVGLEKSDIQKTKWKVKRVTPVSNEFRNFDERMAAKDSRRPRATVKDAGVATSTFVMAPPTFQFNANSLKLTPTPREVEGFHGFMSALNAPKDVPIANLNQVIHKLLQCEYHGSNVFAVLDDGDEEQQMMQTTPLVSPAFMQPATFTFAAEKSTKPTIQSSLRQSIQPASVDIDPEL